jgi:hypothetical protein
MVGTQLRLAWRFGVTQSDILDEEDRFEIRKKVDDHWRLYRDI